MSWLVLVALAMVALVAASGGFEDDRFPVDPRRGCRAEVRSDCRSWIIARVREVAAIRGIGALDPRNLTTLHALRAALAGLCVEASLDSLRWRRIAARLGEERPEEGDVVAEFIAAARELAEAR